jgi:hypothetical protein
VWGPTAQYRSVASMFHVVQRVHGVRIGDQLGLRKLDYHISCSHSTRILRVVSMFHVVLRVRGARKLDHHISCSHSTRILRVASMFHVVLRVRGARKLDHHISCSHSTRIALQPMSASFRAICSGSTLCSSHHTRGYGVRQMQFSRTRESGTDALSAFSNSPV